MSRPAIALAALLLLAGCSGIGDADIDCEGDTCDYSIESSSLQGDTTLLVREGGETVGELGDWESSTGTVENGTVVRAYRADWDNGTLEQAVGCYPGNETCVVDGGGR